MDENTLSLMRKLKRIKEERNERKKIDLKTCNIIVEVIVKELGEVLDNSIVADPYGNSDEILKFLNKMTVENKKKVFPIIGSRVSEHLKSGTDPQD